MQKLPSKNARSARFGGATKYDAHHTVLSKTYGALADLRRELADSKTRVAEREEILRLFSTCADSQRAWLLLEDYFEKLSLSRKDFTAQDWWPGLMGADGKARLEQVALLFLRARRPLPTELLVYANASRFAEIEQAEREQKVLQELEHWLFPPAPAHLDSPRAALRVICEPQPAGGLVAMHALAIHFNLFRPRTGARIRPLSEIVELTARSAHEQELFSAEDWEFIQWLAETCAGRQNDTQALQLTGFELLQWPGPLGRPSRLELKHQPLRFEGQMIHLVPHLENGDSELSFTQRLLLPNQELQPLEKAIFFLGRPSVVLVDRMFYLVRNPPPASLLEYWAKTPSVPVRKLSHRLRTHLRKTPSAHGVDWEQLCTTHAALPQFVFELNEETVRLRLLARTDRDQSLWQWTGQEWQRDPSALQKSDRPEILEDGRLQAAVEWLRRLDWFTPE